MSYTLLTTALTLMSVLLIGCDHDQGIGSCKQPILTDDICTATEPTNEPDTQPYDPLADDDSQAEPHPSKKTSTEQEDLYSDSEETADKVSAPASQNPAAQAEILRKTKSHAPNSRRTTVPTELPEVITIALAKKAIYVPEEFTPAPEPIAGDFNGATFTSGADAEVASFVAAKPALDGEQDATAVSETVEESLATISGITTLSKSQPQRGSDTILSQYLCSTAAPMSTVGMANSILQKVGLNHADGQVSNLPSAPSTAVLATVFRCSVTVKFYNSNSIIILVAVTAEANYSLFASIIISWTDGSNVQEDHEVLVTREDRFVAATEPQADFLFVVDNSGSMKDEQDAVSQAAQEFFAAISKTGTNFSIGVITTDSDQLRGGSFTNELEAFQKRIKAGIHGHWIETGIYFAERALQAIAQGDQTDGTVTLEGYPRYQSTDDATGSLSVIILSDEASQYQSRAGKKFDSQSNLFIQRGYKVYSIINPRSAGQYDDLALATGGSSASITDTAAFAAIMELIADNATGTASSYTLSEQPISSSIVVSINGIEIPRDGTDGWQYRPNANAIVFCGSAVPQAGAAVTVTYRGS